MGACDVPDNGNGARKWIGSRFVEALLIAGVTAGVSTYTATRVMEVLIDGLDRRLTSIEAVQATGAGRLVDIQTKLTRAATITEQLERRADQRDGRVERLADVLSEIRARTRALESGRR